MFKTKRNIVLALALCALLLPASVIAKEQVERPFNLHGVNMVILDFEDLFLNGNPIVPWWIQWEVGEATHLGPYTRSGGGTLDTLTGYLTGNGHVTADNGDKVFWESAGQIDAPRIVTFTGGTGRFEGASGSFTMTITAETQKWEGYLLIIEYTFRGIGTLTY